MGAVLLSIWIRNMEQGIVWIYTAYVHSTTPPTNNQTRREIGGDAVWTLSSAKVGNGVEQLRD